MELQGHNGVGVWPGMERLRQVKDPRNRQQTIHQPINALEIQLVATINLLHVSALECRPQGVFEQMNIRPTRSSLYGTFQSL
jgi:hypothetical protein